MLAVGLPLSGLLAWAIDALFLSKVAAAQQYAVRAGDGSLALRSLHLHL